MVYSQVTKPCEEKYHDSQKNQTLSQVECQSTIHELMQEKMRLAIKKTLVVVLEEEGENFIHTALYQRTPSRKGYHNGYYECDMVTRGESICDTYVKGVNTTGVGEIIETQIDTHPSPSAVSRVFHSLDEKFTGWKQRKLKAHYRYIFTNAIYFIVNYGENGCKMHILAMIGIDADWKREVLAFTVDERENRKAQDDLLID